MMKLGLFSWIPKNAGTSVWQRLCGGSVSPERIGPHIHRFRFSASELLSTGHWPLAMVAARGWMTRRDIARRRVGMIVRNPWARMVTVWRTCRERHGVRDFGEFVERIALGDQADRLTPSPKYNGVAFAWPQDRWLRWADGKWIDASAVKIESIDAGWGKLCCEWGLAFAPLGHYNRSSTKDYRPHYTDQSREQVAKYERMVIDRFGYTFDGERT